MAKKKTAALTGRPSFQPRWLQNINDPENSEWELAIVDPDEDNASFNTFEEAWEEGLAWCEERGCKPNSEHFVIALLRVDYLRLVR